MPTAIGHLVSNKLVTDNQLKFVKQKSREYKKPIQDVMCDLGVVSEDEFFDAARSTFQGLQWDPDREDLDVSLSGILPPGMAESCGILPVKKRDGFLYLAMSNPHDLEVIDQVSFLTGLPVRPLLCRRSQLELVRAKVLNKDNSVAELLRHAMRDVGVPHPEVENRLPEDRAEILGLDEEDSSVVRFLNKILLDAVNSRASDIHIEPQESQVEVRFRVDGYLRRIVSYPRDLHQRLVARIKVQARLDIAEQRKFQDGRIKIQVEGGKIDLRISIIPAYYGEKVVIRILDTQSTRFELAELGFHEPELKLFRDAIRKPQGVVLVTGPTGSGKTTTLYSALQDIKCDTKNIVTIEDPVEYLIDGINQLQLNRIKDITFANGLRSILRQDPDVLLVGEIRDRETADIAFRASLTGHLVFSTLHTNNSASTVVRLLDIGLEPYLLSSSINLIVSQRLVRVICPYCRKTYQPDQDLLEKFDSYIKRENIKTFYTGRGCLRCDGTGFYGRTSLFEMLQFDGEMRGLIEKKVPEHILVQAALENGMRPLAAAGVQRVAEGMTTLEEVAKVADVIEELQGPVPRRLVAEQNPFDRLFSFPSGDRD